MQGKGIIHLTVAAVLLFGGTAAISAQNRRQGPELTFSDNFYIGSSDTLAFWAWHNTGGMAPVSGGNLLRINAVQKSTQLGDSRFNYTYGADVAGILSIGKASSSAFISEAYAGLSRGRIRMNAGLFRKPSEFASVSLSGGDISNSGNARTQPGYSLSLDKWTLPFGGGRFAISGSWGDYMFLGPRTTLRPMVHNEEGYLDVRLFKGLTLRVGGEDWGMWGGKGVPSEAGNYLRMALGLSGGETAHIMDQANVMGNHLGRTLVRLRWEDKGWMASLSKDSPFEDGSGIKQRNFPDGIWTAYFHSDKAHAWISDVSLEFIYTRCQSGPLHARPATEEEQARQDPADPNYGTVILGGQDEYFNHYYYTDGWTSYGMTIGVPLLLARNADTDGITRGVWSNMCEGVHLGVSGSLFGYYPYRFMATFARQYGKCTAPLQHYATMSSFAFDGVVPSNMILATAGNHLDFSYGLYADAGTLYGKPRISLMFGIKYRI